MRPDPGKPPAVPSAGPHLPQGMMRQVRRYELITPLFGGGVRPQEADLVTVVRGSEIRGHLRFWWRACRGGAYGGELGKMKEAEDALWGAAGGDSGPQPSQVTIAVTLQERGRPFPVIDRNGNPVSIAHFRSPYSYVAFPMQQNPHSQTIEGIVFDLEIVYPASEQSEVEAALWAWENFGGIGGRTRRGFGALSCTKVDGAVQNPCSVQQLQSALQQQLQTWAIPGPWPQGVPHLAGNTTLRVTAPMQDSLGAWRHLIRRLKEFRQYRKTGSQPNHPGPSTWPEPDAIRSRFPGVPFVHGPRHPVNKFPRAVFGLPIVFHFIDPNDPPHTILQGVGAGRLASPLILRPRRCSDGAAGLGLILQGSTGLPGGLELHGAPAGPPIVTRLDPADAAAIPILKGQHNVLAAFLDTL